MNRRETRKMAWQLAASLLGALAVSAISPLADAQSADGNEILNVSYDPTRELWRDVNEAFGPAWEKKSGKAIVIKQSHGGSGSQARAVIDGLEADVVTLALEPDVAQIAKAGLVKSDWKTRLPNDSVPYTSTIVFVVRKGNPKGIKDWPDLAKDGIEIVTPNPKTSGNGKLSFLSAWGSVVTRGGTDDQAQQLVTKIYERAPVLDTGARGSTTTFVQKKIGDVHLTWENEAKLEVKESGGDLEIVYPPTSFLAQPPVAIVDANVDMKGTRAAAQAYLDFIYSDEGQEIAARNFYRPSNEAVLAKHAADFPKIDLFPITAVAPSWEAANKRFFGEGGVFEKIYKPR
ncbi:MAG: sulfate ABC transporter substrate-binding protein [Alphaproteobacteria bacterium]